MSPRVRRAAVAAALLVAAGLIGWAAYRAWSSRTAIDPAAAFLARHWAHPIAPQGAPPPHRAALESALAPQACGQCHAAQLADWSTSLHSRAMGPGILWQLRTLGQEEGNECLRCHAPLAEQKALVARERRWPNAPDTAPPEYVGEGLHLQGVTCAVCHVRGHQRFGPPSRKAVRSAGARAPHGGSTPQAAFSDSRFCAPCHQFPPEGRRVNGKLLENTFEEWRASAAARDGRTCQSCHMPQRRHLWRGVHDAEMVSQALARSLVVSRIDARRIRISAEVGNRGAGHFLPTYVVARIRVQVHLRGERAGSHLLVGHHDVGRTLDASLERELADTRLAPGARHAMSFEVPVPEGRWWVSLRAEVAPAEHYERMYRDMDARHTGLDGETRALLHAALAAAVAARYRLDDLEVTVPGAAGEPARAVAK